MFPRRLHSDILTVVKLKICGKCKRPYMEDRDFCPNCPKPYLWNQESWLNLGCLLLTILPLFMLIIFWAFFFLSFALR